MSLGVLNNLSAVYAENNLNNSNNSLNTVLQQLSSGSKINSGADDAAGLSLVNGLQANQQALTQSITNATEGVGLLQVADGALSQVTSLLNRAVTLATEASNGTLNSSQDTAANQEYQSILSEISNIGSTTTYNDEAVFNSSTNIYTGDSSTVGSSIDALNIRTLSSSNVGDTGGTMAYSNGANNVFLNLSSSTANAAVTDSLSGTSTTLDVNYLVKGSGTVTTASTTITVGQGSNFDNTVGGLISAINDSGLGLTASFATQAQAGVQGGGSQTGIQITGGLVSAGMDPNVSSTSGTLDLTGLSAGATLALGATVDVTQGSNSHTFTIDSTNNTLGNLATAIQSYTTTNWIDGVKANVITNGDGTQSLALSNAAGGGALSVTTTNAVVQTPDFGAGTGTTGTSVTVNDQGAQVTGNQYIATTDSTITVGTGSGTEAGGDILTAGSQITITNTNFAPNGAQAFTFIVGQGTNVIGAHASTIYTGNTDAGAAALTMQGLADSITAESSTLGASATVTTAGLVVTTGTAATAENLQVTNNTLTSSTTSTQLALYQPTIAGQTAVGGAPAITVLDDGTGNNAETDALLGSITLTNAYGTTTFETGNGVSGNGTVFLGAGASTYTGLVAYIHAHKATLGYDAAWNATAGAGNTPAMVLTGIANGNDAITVGASTLEDTSDTNAVVTADTSGTGSVTPATGTDTTLATSSTAILQLASGSLNGATLAGAISLNFNSQNQVFIMGSQPTNGTAVPGAIYTGANTVTSLINAINSAGALGVAASPGAGPDAGDAIYLQGGQGIAQAITMNTVVPLVAGTETALAVYTGTSTSNYSAGATGQVGNDAVDNLTAQNNLSVATPVNTNDVMSGSITVANGAVTDTFTVGTGSDSYDTGTHTGAYFTNNTNTTVGTGLPGALENYGSTLAGLASLISAQTATLGVTAEANASGLTLTQSATATHYTGDTLSTSNNTLTDVTAGTFSSITTSNQLANENDTMSGALVFNVGSNADHIVTMADVTGADDPGTVAGLISYINANSSTLGISAAWVPAGGSSTFGAIKLTSGTEGASGTVNVATSLTNLTDTTTGAALTYTANSAYDMGLSGSIVDATTAQNAATFVSDSKASSGIATISYTDASGIGLSTTDLSNQSDAQDALKLLNSAITAVAAQDGYIGAQINTLNAVSQVISTQSENVKSAQNAVQATDYASATSNMSKYEILSQTGISALAQANSVQQEVLKLLQ